MWFLDGIVEWLASARDAFDEAVREVHTWPWPFWYLQYPLYDLHLAFYYLTYYFGNFNYWLDWAAGRIDAILDTWNIWSYFQWWFDAAENAWNWVRYAPYYVWQIVDDWWSATQSWLMDWISDLESWTLTQINNVRTATLGIVGDLQTWTSTQLNNFQATINTLWGNYESWTLTQINNVRTATLGIVGDLQTWTTTEINNIQAIIAALTDWGDLLVWITAWWNERLLDIQSLINSAFLVREPFWAGWQDWRDKVTEFFTDPEDWMYKSVDRIIERFW